MANGLLSDWMSGTGVYGNPNAVDPQTGVPYADTRAAQLGALGNIGSLLIAAGQPMTGAQRAQLLGQIGPQISGMQTDIYNAAQRRLMQAQFAEKQAELADTAKIRDLMKDPTAFKAATGYDIGQFTGLGPGEIGAALKQITVSKLTRDPNEAALNAAKLKQAEREATQPKTVTAGGKVWQLNEQTGKWDVIAEGEPSGGLEGRNQSLIISAMKDPEIANSPEYSVAYNQLYGPKIVQAYNPATQQMEYKSIAPPPPQGVVPPKFNMQAPASQQQSPVAQGEAVPSIAATGDTQSLIAQPPKEEKALTEDQSKATGFSKRMIEASKILDPLDYSDAAKPGVVEGFMGPVIGKTLTNVMSSNDRQLYRQAQVDWVTANLRKESGAVIGQDELETEIGKYFPQIGDGPAVIERKRKSRENAMQGMVVSAGKGAEKLGLKVEPYEPLFEIKIQTMPPQDLLKIDDSKLDDNSKALYLARLRQLRMGGVK